MDRGAWRATVHRVTKERLTLTFYQGCKCWGRLPAGREFLSATPNPSLAVELTRGDRGSRLAASGGDCQVFGEELSVKFNN